MFEPGEDSYFSRVDKLEPVLISALEAICELQRRVLSLEDRMEWLVSQLDRAHERD